MKPASQITDRAKRYRANKRPPPGRKLCNICGSRKNIDIDHITGNESDDEPENLMYLCRPCNTTKGIVQARNRIGVRTRQYNPVPRIRTFAQFKTYAAGLLGVGPADPGEATAAIRALSPATRAGYAEKIAANPEPPTYAQYAHGVSIHQRGTHDEGGAIIHATPPALRRQYAEQIARTKATRRGAVPF